MRGEMIIAISKEEGRVIKEQNKQAVPISLGCLLVLSKR